MVGVESSSCISMNNRTVYNCEGNRAIVFKEFGDPDKVLRLVHAPKPKIQPGLLLVRLLLRPVHNFDFLLCSDVEVAHSFYRFPELGLNPDNVLKTVGIVSGVEGGLGIVEEIGEGVTRCSTGQRVHLSNIYPCYQGPSFQGSWQDYILVREEDAVHVPDDIKDEVAAQFSANPWTTFALCKHVESICPKGEHLVLNAAASVMGRLFIQYASNIQGYKVIAVVRREELKDELLSLGAAAVINSTSEDVPKRVKHITDGKGAYLGIDILGGASTKDVGSSVRNEGQVLVVGELGDGELGDTDIVISQKDMWRNVQFSYWDASPYFLEKEKREVTVQSCWKLFGEGIWKLASAELIDLADFKRALSQARKPARTGKVLLESR